MSRDGHHRKGDDAGTQSSPVLRGVALDAELGGTRQPNECHC